MKQYIVDAFTDKVFSGNPAAVCILEKELDAHLMLQIAKENNLSETAFAIKEADGYHLRWFTPVAEIDLCGHATLATAFILLTYYEKNLTSLKFRTLSGSLLVNRVDDRFEMSFPSYQLTEVAVTNEIEEALGVRPLAAYQARDLVCILENSDQVVNLRPRLDKVSELDGLLVHVTARGATTDIVSRSFAPKLGIDEDPVCGSGHCHLVPYWSQQLGKENLLAYQASERGGYLYCQNQGERILLAGHAVLFAEAEIFIDGSGR